MQALLARGNGAMLQRRVRESAGDMAAVVRNAVSHTLTIEQTPSRNAAAGRRLRPDGRPGCYAMLSLPRPR